jgi:hypothetical protein
MRVLHIHHGDNPRWGGGVIAMLRLHEGLKAAGIASRVLCGVKSLASADSVQMTRPRLAEALLRRVTSRAGFNDLRAVGAFAVPRHPLVRAADAVHVQGFHGGPDYAVPTARLAPLVEVVAHEVTARANPLGVKGRRGRHLGRRRRPRERGGRRPRRPVRPRDLPLTAARLRTALSTRYS